MSALVEALGGLRNFGINSARSVFATARTTVAHGRSIANVTEFSRINNEQDPNAQDREGFTILHRGVQLTARGAMNGFQEIERMLGTGSNPNLGTIYGVTPLHTAIKETGACEASRLDVLNLLLANNANPNARTSKGETPLHYLMRASSLSENIRIRISLKLLKAGANPNTQDNEGNTPLYRLYLGHKWCSGVGIVKVRTLATTLVLNGANPGITNQKFENAYGQQFYNSTTQLLDQVYKELKLK